MEYQQFNRKTGFDDDPQIALKNVFESSIFWIFYFESTQQVIFFLPKNKISRKKIVKKQVAF